VTLAGTVINWALSSSFFASISASTTYTFSNTTDGQTIVVAIDNTSGSATVTWPGSIVWPGGNVPTQSAPGTDVYTFVDILGTIYGAVLQAFAT
jgi:hypothetical protein